MQRINLHGQLKKTALQMKFPLLGLLMVNDASVKPLKVKRKKVPLNSKVLINYLHLREKR